MLLNFESATGQKIETSPAKFRFDTAENEPSIVTQFAILAIESGQSMSEAQTGTSTASTERRLTLFQACSRVRACRVSTADIPNT